MAFPSISSVLDPDLIDPQNILRIDLILMQYKNTSIKGILINLFIQFNFFISPFFHCLLWALTFNLTANVMSMANPGGCVKICGTEGVKEELGL